MHINVFEKYSVDRQNAARTSDFKLKTGKVAIHFPEDSDSSLSETTRNSSFILRPQSHHQQ